MADSNIPTIAWGEGEREGSRRGWEGRGGRGRGEYKDWMRRGNEDGWVGAGSKGEHARN